MKYTYFYAHSGIIKLPGFFGGDAPFFGNGEATMNMPITSLNEVKALEEHIKQTILKERPKATVRSLVVNNFLLLRTEEEQAP